MIELGNTLWPAPPAGAPADRLRTLLTRTDSLTVATPYHRAELLGRHTLTPAGTLRLLLPEPSALARHLTDTGEVAARVEVADLGPAPTRDRVRAQATLLGWLTPDGRAGGDLVALLDLAEADLADCDGTGPVDPDALPAARPDPLWQAEPDLLALLGGRAADPAPDLLRLVPAPHDRGVRRAHPIQVDRYGVVLRLEAPEGHRDLRLPFPGPVSDPDLARAHLTRLIGAAPPLGPRPGTPA